MKRRDLLAMVALPTLAGTARAQVGSAPIRILVCAPRRRLDRHSAQFSAFVDSEIARWGKAVKFSGARPE